MQVRKCSRCNMVGHREESCDEKSKVVVMVFDTETTGLEPELGAEVLQICVRMGLEDGAQTRLWNIRPLRGVTEESVAKNGITHEMTLSWPTFGEVAEEIATFFKRADVVVGYNPDYDMKMVRAEMTRSRVECRLDQIVICCKRLWDNHRPRPPRDLQAAYQQFVDPNGFQDAHTALGDVKATVEVIRAQLETFELLDKPWAEMDPERMTWWGPSNHVIWKTGILVCNFGKYRSTAFHTLDRGMLQWILRQEFPKHVRDLAQRCMEPRRGMSVEQFGQEVTQWAKNY